MVVYRNPETNDQDQFKKFSVNVGWKVWDPPSPPQKKSQGNRIGGELIEVEIWYPNKRHEFQSLLSKKRHKTFKLSVLLGEFGQILLETKPKYTQIKCDFDLDMVLFCYQATISIQYVYSLKVKVVLVIHICQQQPTLNQGYDDRFDFRCMGMMMQWYTSGSIGNTLPYL